MTLKIKHADFQQITRSRTAGLPINAQRNFEQIASALLEAVFPTGKGIRLPGISLSSLGDEPDDESQLQFDI